MLMQGVNDDEESLKKYEEELKQLKYDRLYINTPVRPPAEIDVKAVDHDKMDLAEMLLGGVSIDLLESKGFHSEISDDYEAIRSIIQRHPMNQFELEGFLETRGCVGVADIMNSLKLDPRIDVVSYKGYHTYRMK
jgi:wyosine [tRNA(Phe)-imidazoG37] synthetase (radical SAM superfamily)